MAVCVAVFVVFGMIASEGKGAREHLAEVRTGGANRRWQAAFELAKVLQAGKDPALTDPAFTAEVAKVFDEAVRRRPARAPLSRPRPRPHRRPARGARAAEGGGRRGARTDRAPTPRRRCTRCGRSGVIGDPQAVPRLVALARSEDAGLRKAAVHALGAFPRARRRARRW